LRSTTGDFGINHVAMAHLGLDQLAGECGSAVIALLLGQVAFKHDIGRALAEIRLKHGCQGKPSPGPPTAEPVSPRRHRPGRSRRQGPGQGDARL